jgi:hypothetical protein
VSTITCPNGIAVLKENNVCELTCMQVPQNLFLLLHTWQRYGRAVKVRALILMASALLLANTRQRTAAIITR